MSDQRVPNEEQFHHERLDDVDVYDVKEAFEETRQRQEQEAFDNSTVRLNVGGHYFTTSIETLTKDPNSLLAAMFSEGFQKKKPSKDGSFFIDRDGTHFRYILNYLRDGELVLPENETFLKEIKAEAKFYQIQGILHEFPERDFEYAIYVSEPTRTLNKRFEEPEIQTNDEHSSCLPLGGICRRLFQTRVSPTSFSVGAPLNDFPAERFHARCDKDSMVVKSFQGLHDNEEQHRVVKSFQESKILTNDEHLSVLKGWLPPGGTWLLLFRASRDGFAAKTFHSKCDLKGPTVTIVKCDNNVFGGFTENSWRSKFNDRCKICTVYKHKYFPSPLSSTTFSDVISQIIISKARLQLISSEIHFSIS